MEPKTAHPRWYRSFSIFVIGVGFGGCAVMLFYELHVSPIGSPWPHRIVLPYLVGVGPWVVLSLFDVYFAVRRYRASRRAMDGRVAGGSL